MVANTKQIQENKRKASGIACLEKSDEEEHDERVDKLEKEGLCNQRVFVLKVCAMVFKVVQPVRHLAVCCVD